MWLPLHFPGIKIFICPVSLSMKKALVRFLYKCVTINVIPYFVDVKCLYGVVTFNYIHRAHTKGRGFSANYGIQKTLYYYKRHLNYY
jgi:hypothetical protein